MRKAKKILIITSSGGGGLLQAAIAKEQEIREEDSHAVIIKRDMMKDWYWKWIGKFGIRRWDEAQKKGDVATLEWLINRQGFGDLVFWPRTFFLALWTFFKEDVDRVIDTQPQGTSAILHALRIFNAKRKKQVMLEKVIVDLPTKKNTHFLRPIKELSSKNREWVRLFTIPPLLHENETAELFWQRNCNLSEQSISYEYFPIRQEFLRYKEKKRGHARISLSARFFNNEEKELVKKALKKGAISNRLEKDRVRFRIEPEDKLITVLLGSQPAFDATLGYVKKVIKAVEEDLGTAPVHLFVLCAQHRPNDESLLKKVVDLVVLAKLPKRLSIIPLSFQTEEMIAPLFHRSDLTCTKSGGQTAMELMCVMHGQICIHSETKRIDRKPTIEELLKGIPGWESGNALYMCKHYRAKLVTPELFEPVVQEMLQIDCLVVLDKNSCSNFCVKASANRRS